MIINSIKNSSFVYHARAYSKLENIQKRVSQLQKDLIWLDENPDFSHYLAHTHYLLFHRSPQMPVRGASRCRDTANAIIQRNLFGQKLFREIKNLEKFELELQDSEEGAFLVRMPQLYFVNSNEVTTFQGHTFVILKTNEGAYMVAQSFVEKYSLKSFILNNKMIYESFDQLNENILKPLKMILNSGKWTEVECQVHYDLTGVYPDWLIGFSPLDYSIQEVVSFGRSSNIDVEGSHSLVLGGFEDGKFKIPQEWAEIAKQSRE